MTADDSFGRLDDDDYPAYTMGRAAEMLGTTPGFLRAIGEARLITPLRSEGGHRRYSRYQLRIAARARELVDRGTPIATARATASSRTFSPVSSLHAATASASALATTPSTRLSPDRLRRTPARAAPASCRARRGGRTRSRTSEPGPDRVRWPAPGAR